MEPFARAKRTTCGTGWSSITPQMHGSWLNKVEIEIDVLRSQRLDRRIAEPERLVSEIAAWERQRNAAGARIKWMFTTERTRAKVGAHTRIQTMSHNPCSEILSSYIDLHLGCVSERALLEEGADFLGLRRSERSEDLTLLVKSLSPL